MQFNEGAIWRKKYGLDKNPAKILQEKYESNKI